MNGPALVVGVLVACLGASWLFHRDIAVLNPRVERSEVHPSSDVSAASHSLLHGTAAEMEGVGDTDMSGFADAAASDSNAGTPNSGQDDGARARAMQDDLALIKNTFAEQYGDSAWTARIYDVSGRAASSTAAFNGVIQDFVDCRETICKLALGYSDPLVFDEFVNELTVNLKGDLSAGLYFDEHRNVGGNSRVDVYLIRE